MNYFEENSKNILMEKIAVKEDSKENHSSNKIKTQAMVGSLLTNAAGVGASVAGQLAPPYYMKKFMPEVLEDVRNGSKSEPGVRTGKRQKLIDKYVAPGKVKVVSNPGTLYAHFYPFEPKETDKFTGNLRNAGPSVFAIKNQKESFKKMMGNVFNLANKYLTPEQRRKFFKKPEKLTEEDLSATVDAFLGKIDRAAEGADYVLHMPEAVKDNAVFYHEAGHAQGMHRGNFLHNKHIMNLRGLSPLGTFTNMVAGGAITHKGITNTLNANTAEEVQKAQDQANRNANINTAVTSLLHTPMIGQELEASWRGSKMMRAEEGLKGFKGWKKSFGTFQGVPTYLAATILPMVATHYGTKALINSTAQQRLKELQGKNKMKTASALFDFNMAKTAAENFLEKHAYSEDEIIDYALAMDEGYPGRFADRHKVERFRNTSVSLNEPVKKNIQVGAALAAPVAGAVLGYRKGGGLPGAVLGTALGGLAGVGTYAALPYAYRLVNDDYKRDFDKANQMDDDIDRKSYYFVRNRVRTNPTYKKDIHSMMAQSEQAEAQKEIARAQQLQAWQNTMDRLEGTRRRDLYRY